MLNIRQCNVSHLFSFMCVPYPQPSFVFITDRCIFLAIDLLNVALSNVKYPARKVNSEVIRNPTQLLLLSRIQLTRTVSSMFIQRKDIHRRRVNTTITPFPFGYKKAKDGKREKKKHPISGLYRVKKMCKKTTKKKKKQREKHNPLPRSVIPEFGE